MRASRVTIATIASQHPPTKWISKPAKCPTLSRSFAGCCPSPHTSARTLRAKGTTIRREEIFWGKKMLRWKKMCRICWRKKEFSFGFRLRSSERTTSCAVNVVGPISCSSLSPFVGTYQQGRDKEGFYDFFFHCCCCQLLLFFPLIFYFSALTSGLVVVVVEVAVALVDISSSSSIVNFTAKKKVRPLAVRSIELFCCFYILYLEMDFWDFFFTKIYLQTLFYYSIFIEKRKL